MKLILSFHFYMGLRNETQVINSAQQCLYPLCHITCMWLAISFFKAKGNFLVYYLDNGSFNAHSQCPSFIAENFVLKPMFTTEIWELSSIVYNSLLFFLKQTLCLLHLLTAMREWHLKLKWHSTYGLFWRLHRDRYF